MRTTTFLTLPCALALTLLSASSTAQGPVIGLKGGLNMSTLYSDAVSDDKARFGLNGGGFIRVAPEEAIGLQVEVLYSSKGNHSTYSGFAGLIDQTVDFNLNYLEVPLLVAFRLGDGAAELHAGLYGAYLVGANVSTDGDLGDGSEELDKDNFSSMDFGLAGGIAFNAGPAQIGARVLYGLTEIASSDEAELLLEDAKNVCGQVYIALGIPSGN